MVYTQVYTPDYYKDKDCTPLEAIIHGNSKRLEIVSNKFYYADKNSEEILKNTGTGFAVEAIDKRFGKTIEKEFTYGDKKKVLIYNVRKEDIGAKNLMHLFEHQFRNDGRCLFSSEKEAFITHLNKIAFLDENNTARINAMEVGDIIGLELGRHAYVVSKIFDGKLNLYDGESTIQLLNAANGKQILSVEALHDAKEIIMKVTGEINSVNLTERRFREKYERTTYTTSRFGTIYYPDSFLAVDAVSAIGLLRREYQAVFTNSGNHYALADDHLNMCSQTTFKDDCIIGWDIHGPAPENGVLARIKRFIAKL